MSDNINSPLLFSPLQVGRMSLSHRVVLPPLNRFRNFKYTHVPLTYLMKEYYTQRASTPGTLIIAEGTLISHEGSGMANTPGIWSDEHVKAWKEVVDSVHQKGCYIYLQIAAPGRAAPLDGIEADKITLSGPSPIALSTQPLPVPKELTKQEIQSFKEQFVYAAKRAVFDAGFDGVELHAAYGYYIDQFLQDISNKRTDEYGGSIENRSRAPLEIVKAVADVIGENRVGIRISPWSKLHDMGMQDPIPQFSHFLSTLKEVHPRLAYLHAVEPRIESESGAQIQHANPSNNFIREVWSPKVFITAGGYTRESAILTAEEKGDLIAFGRWYIANPDLPRRLKENLPLNKYDRTTFYVPAETPTPEVGYVDYPFYTNEKMEQ